MDLVFVYAQHVLLVYVCSFWFVMVHFFFDIVIIVILFLSHVCFEGIICHEQSVMNDNSPTGFLRKHRQLGLVDMAQYQTTLTIPN